ncbi:hypothetical protein Cch01nite_04850 [Cellulomonas chitinilytica]|uniref:Uncharacterized protein n=1 Tax=Cellulomonas chitinilytica TaxID=398759 RepID=A0A919TZU3_9CELL|nr:hypothetical protein Cch01nite_04850 [Cellulomonas chitinilytica]
MWSWAASDAEADARRREADELVGERIRSVRYFSLDYRRSEMPPELIDAGPRTVVDASEWTDPTWLCDGFDTTDYGFEIATDSGAVFSLTWDPPGHQEGIGLQPVPMLGSGVRGDADVAIWEVDGRSPSWTSMVGTTVTGIELHYEPWAEGTGAPLWCPRITIHGGAARVEVIMGDRADGRLVPSADNIAVLHPGTPLPAWCTPGP